MAKKAKKTPVANKKKNAKPAKPAKVAKPKPNARRINTHGRNGSTSVAAAPEPEPLDLGPIVLPEGDGAAIALRKLAEVNDRALAAHKRYEDLKGQTKLAKEKWDSLSEELQTLLRRFTHKSDLPLIDIAEREADQKRMETAAKDPLDEPIFSEDLDPTDIKPANEAPF